MHPEPTCGQIVCTIHSGHSGWFDFTGQCRSDGLVGFKVVRTIPDPTIPHQRQLPSREHTVPELPEVETMVRGIRPAIIGGRIAQVLACPCPCRPLQMNPGFPNFATRQEGRTIVAVERFAKRILLKLDDESLVAIEPRMTGLMLLTDPPDESHLRLEWQIGRAHV